VRPAPAPTPTPHVDEVDRLRRENERLRRENADHAKQIKDLERQLALRQQNSTITSKPPSSDGLAGQPRVRGVARRAAGRAAGSPGIRATTARWCPPSASTR
jgi:hypothetical protein